MRIGELSRHTKLPASRIRLYEANGLIPKVERDADGYRDFPENLIVTLRWIAVAQELGFTLREIGASLSEPHGAAPSKYAMLESLRAKLNSVDENIERLSRRRTLMAALVDDLEIER